MEYQIITGEEFDENFLPRVMDIDRLCYEDEYVGELSQMQYRYRKNNKTFVCIMDGDNLAGYINFFPVTDALWDEIVETGMKIRDDDIMPDEIEEYSHEKENRLFIISIAIHPEYRKDKNAVITLTNGFIDYLNKLQTEGYRIAGISATAVSEDGQKFLRSRMFHLYREIEEENKVYVCDEQYLEKLLENKLYFKSYKDDIFLFLPYADSKKNTKLEKLYTAEHQIDFAGIPDPEAYILKQLDDCLNYEYQSDVVKEMHRAYIGEFQFLHTSDEYPEAYERPKIIGEETAYISLFMHQSSNMYVLQIYIPNCRYSTSQVEDQLSQNYIKLRKKDAMNSKGFYEYFDLDSFLRKEYGLISCGKGKSLICMSNKPAEEQEFLNILSAEVYNSLHQDFHINYSGLKEAAKEDLSIYDYYEVYLTENVIAFVLDDYDTFDREEVLERAATYIFIAEIVLFQNTALSKMTKKVSNALANEGDVSYEYISQMYQDYAKTIKFWQTNNYKYFGTQREADQIKKAFGHDVLKQDYYEQQEFLEHIVEIKNAQQERRNGFIINVVAILLAVFQLQEFAVYTLTNFYASFDIPVVATSNSFVILTIGISIWSLLIWFISKKNKYHKRKTKLYGLAGENNDEEIN